MKVKTLLKFIFCCGLTIFFSLFVTLRVIEAQDKQGLDPKNALYSSSYALVIGIGNYYDEYWLPQSKAVKDAILVGNELENQGFKVTYLIDPDLNDLRTQLKRFFLDKKIDNESRLIIWYSGHSHSINGQDFLIPKNAPSVNDSSLKKKAFPIRELEILLKDTKAKYVYTVFDARISSTNFINEVKNPSSNLFNPGLIAHQYLCSCIDGQYIKNDGSFCDAFLKAIQDKSKSNINGDNYLTANEIGASIKNKIYIKTQPKYGKTKNSDGEFFFLSYFWDNLSVGESGPEMIDISGGSFQMGDLQGKGFKDEKAVNQYIRRIAVSRFEVTFKEFDLYCEKKGITRKPLDNFWGRGNMPVIYVSWEDAVAYTDWLSKQTGCTYRLPTEAEWEYFARAGEKTNYWWGNEIGEGNANCDGCGPKNGVDANKKTAPVGSFNPNPLGIYDTVGNVWEWTCSEYTDEYNGKESRCLDKITTGGEAIVLRGGSWDEKPKMCRVSNRKAGYPGERSLYIGFRVVKELK